MSVLAPPRRKPTRYREEPPLQVLVEIDAPGWRDGVPIETHAGYLTAGRTLCGESKARFRSRRGRGQHRPPSCPVCAEAARLIAEALLALDEPEIDVEDQAA